MILENKFTGLWGVLFTLLYFISGGKMLVDLGRERLADLSIAFLLRFVECFDIRMHAYFLVGFTRG